MKNRGRFQAQGNGLEKSAPWATDDEISKVDGDERISFLELQLTRAECGERIEGIRKARQFVARAPVSGCDAVIIKSFYDIRNREVRVDLEIRFGCAFIG